MLSTQGINQERHPRMVEQPRMGVFLKRHTRTLEGFNNCLRLGFCPVQNSDVSKGDVPAFSVSGSATINRKEAVSTQQRFE